MRKDRTSQIYQIKEQFIDKVYGNDFTGKIVVDLGASIGNSEIYFAVNGVKKVIALEPFSESFEIAKEKKMIKTIFGARLFY